jgi:hypothetical protein
VEPGRINSERSKSQVRPLVRPAGAPPRPPPPPGKGRPNPPPPPAEGKAPPTAPLLLAGAKKKVVLKKRSR